LLRAELPSVLTCLELQNIHGHIGLGAVHILRNTVRGEGVVGFVTVCYVGEGVSEPLLRNEKNVNVLKDMGEEKDERNDCPSRKIVGIRAIEE